MTPTRPYLLRAFFEWIVDNDMTPYLLAEVDDTVVVPPQYVEHGRIILNIAPEAVIDLALENDFISFNAQFMQLPFDVYIPIEAVKAIYAKETGRGMFFRPEDMEGERPPSPPMLRVTKNPVAPTAPLVKGKAKLSLVSNKTETPPEED